VLPWRDVNKNVSQLAEPNKGRYLSWIDLKDDFGNQVLPVTVDDDTECPSPGCRNDDCLKLGDNAVGDDFLSKIDVECLGKSSKINDESQEDKMTHKSTRLEKLPTNKYQDFFMLNEDHKFNNVSEQSVSGAGDSSYNLDKTSSLTCVNDCGGNTIHIGSINTLTRNKSLKIFHQNITGLGNKANELYSHLHHDLPHILRLSERHLSEFKLQFTHLTNYSLEASYCRKTFLKKVSVYLVTEA
jgi:hypothetical protein